VSRRRSLSPDRESYCKHTLSSNENDTNFMSRRRYLSSDREFMGESYRKRTLSSEENDTPFASRKHALSPDRESYCKHTISSSENDTPFMSRRRSLSSDKEFMGESYRKRTLSSDENTTPFVSRRRVTSPSGEFSGSTYRKRTLSSDENTTPFVSRRRLTSPSGEFSGSTYRKRTLSSDENTTPFVGRKRVISPDSESIGSSYHNHSPSSDENFAPFVGRKSLASVDNYPRESSYCKRTLSSDENDRSKHKISLSPTTRYFTGRKGFISPDEVFENDTSPDRSATLSPTESEGGYKSGEKRVIFSSDTPVIFKRRPIFGNGSHITSSRRQLDNEIENITNSPFFNLNKSGEKAGSRISTTDKLAKELESFINYSYSHEPLKENIDKQIYLHLHNFDENVKVANFKGYNLLIDISDIVTKSGRSRKVTCIGLLDDDENYRPFTDYFFEHVVKGYALKVKINDNTYDIIFNRE